MVPKKTKEQKVQNLSRLFRLSDFFRHLHRFSVLVVHLCGSQLLHFLCEAGGLGMCPVHPPVPPALLLPFIWLQILQQKVAARRRICPFCWPRPPADLLPLCQTHRLSRKNAT